MPAAPLPQDRPGGPAHGLSDQEMSRLCAESRAAQGLPRYVEDGPTLDLLAAMLRGVDCADAARRST